jgi:glycosyltransferase involved in cell wall biosynthesis
LVSRALEFKGWSEAISAVALAREVSGRDIHLLLVGDGPEQERLAQTELPSYIHLEGFQRNVRGYFAVADLGFLPSKFEGESFPLVIIECLQSGRPFLATSLGEIPYMLDSPDGPAGVLVELKDGAVDIELFADKIAFLASDLDVYRQLCARVETAAHKFDPGILAEKHDAAYRGCITS